MTKDFAQDLLKLPSQIKSIELSINTFKNKRLIVNNQIEVIQLRIQRQLMELSIDPKNNLSSADKRKVKLDEQLANDSEHTKLNQELADINKTIDSLYIEFNYLDRTFKAIRSQVQLLAVNE